MTSVKLPNGKSYKFAQLPFNEDTLQLLEMLDGTRPDVKISEVLRAVRTALIGCLVRAGHTPEQAEEAISSLPFKQEFEKDLAPIFSAIGLTLDGA